MPCHLAQRTLQALSSATQLTQAIGNTLAFLPLLIVVTSITTVMTILPASREPQQLHLGLDLGHRRCHSSSPPLAAPRRTAHGDALPAQWHYSPLSAVRSHSYHQAPSPPNSSRHHCPDVPSAGAPGPVALALWDALVAVEQVGGCRLQQTASSPGAAPLRPASSARAPDHYLQRQLLAQLWALLQVHPRPRRLLRAGFWALARLDALAGAQQARQSRYPRPWTSLGLLPALKSKGCCLRCREPPHRQVTSFRRLVRLR
eukprot:scaffold916_cov516-Prasinococcus_capsulatus_cf.AAC.7